METHILAQAKDQDGQLWTIIRPEFTSEFEANFTKQTQALLLLSDADILQLFKFGTVTKLQQATIHQSAKKDFVLKVPAKHPLYFVEKLFPDDFVELMFVVNGDLKQLIAQQGGVLLAITDVPEDSKSAAKMNITIPSAHIDLTGEEPVFTGDSDHLNEFMAQYAALRQLKKIPGVKYPLFRQPFVSVLWFNLDFDVQRMLDRLRLRVLEKRSLETIKPMPVVTPNLDHLRVLIEEDLKEFQEVYGASFIQTPDGYPALVRFSKQSIGYQTDSQVTGVDVFATLLTRVGKEDLPYTFYFVGGFGQTAYQVKDYFSNLFPNLREKIIGISTPPKGFVDKEELFSVIADDINKKQPDIIFACLSSPQQELFINKLRKRGVNFGLAFGLGRTFDLYSGYQKREPKIIETLHLGFIYRALTNKTYMQRVVKDFRFALRIFFKG